MVYQLRIYTINRGMMDSWLRLFREQILPIHQKYGLTVEYMPWTLRLWEETPALEDGELVVPQKPGLGLEFSRDTFKQYQVN